MKREVKYPYIYTSSQLGKFFGISIKGIEYYEKKKLISPQRVGNNKQRRFNLNDSYRIFMARYLSQAGFSLNETLGILNSPSKEVALEHVKPQIDKLEKESLRLSVTLAIMKYNYNLLNSVDEGQPFFQVEEFTGF